MDSTAVRPTEAYKLLISTGISVELPNLKVPRYFWANIKLCRAALALAGISGCNERFAQGIDTMVEDLLYSILSVICSEICATSILSHHKDLFIWSAGHESCFLLDTIPCARLRSIPEANLLVACPTCFYESYHKSDIKCFICHCHSHGDTDLPTNIFRFYS